MANSTQNCHVPLSKSEILVTQQTHTARYEISTETEGRSGAELTSYHADGWFPRRKSYSKKKSNTFLLLASTFLMLISATHFSWADLIRERWMDRPLLAKERFSSRPVEQLLCSPVPKCLAAAAMPRLDAPQGCLSPCPAGVQPCLLHWPVSCQRPEQGKATMAWQCWEQEPLWAAPGSRWTHTLQSEPFPCSWEVRSSHQGSTACHTEEEAQTWNSTGVHSLEQEHALRVYWQLIPKVVLSHRAKAWSWCRLTGWQRDMVEMSEWGRNRESCSLKEDADSTNAEHLPGAAGGVFQEPAGHPCWGVSPFTNQTRPERCAQRALLWLKPLCTPDCCRFRLVQTKLRDSFILPHQPSPQDKGSHLQVWLFPVLSWSLSGNSKQFTGVCKLSVAPLQNPSSGQDKRPHMICTDS